MPPERTAPDRHEFVKRLVCPASGELLAYAGNSLPTPKREGISLHLAHCDFCGAEIRLLGRHPPADDEEFVPAPLPLSLFLLAELSLPGSTLL